MLIHQQLEQLGVRFACKNYTGGTPPPRTLIALFALAPAATPAVAACSNPVCSAAIATVEGCVTRFSDRRHHFCASVATPVGSWWHSAPMRQPTIPSNTEVLGGKNKNRQKKIFMHIFCRRTHSLSSVQLHWNMSY